MIERDEAMLVSGRIRRDNKRHWAPWTGLRRQQRRLSVVVLLRWVWRAHAFAPAARQEIEGAFLLVGGSVSRLAGLRPGYLTAICPPPSSLHTNSGKPSAPTACTLRCTEHTMNNPAFEAWDRSGSVILKFGCLVSL